MSYRAELIQRLRRSGQWTNLTLGQRREYRRFTDDQARQAMVLDDSLAVGDPSALRTARYLALKQLEPLFDGALFDEDALSPAGRALGQFFAELSYAGVPLDVIESDLHELNVFVQASLVALNSARPT